MKKMLYFVVAGAWLTGISFSQSAAPAQSPETAPASVAPKLPAIEMHFTAGTLIRAELEKPVDAKKAKVGDQVLAKTTDDLNSSPPGLATKGCKIIGHVVEVVPHQGDSASTLKVAFDRMILKNGSEMALPANIQAVGYADQFDPATHSEQINQMGGGPGVRLGSPPGGVIGAGSGQPSQYGGQRMPTGGGSNPDAKLPFNAKGTVGMSGVELSEAAQESVLTSKKHNVKLENGMQMILRVD